MIHIDKQQLGQIVQKWDKLAKNWDKFDMGQIEQTPWRLELRPETIVHKAGNQFYGLYFNKAHVKVM